MLRTQLWDHIVAERVALRDQLRDLSAEEWETDSLCAGWTVRDVAAHVISAPQLGWGPTLRASAGLWRGYNGMIDADVKRRGQAPVRDILADWDRWAEVPRCPAVVTPKESLIDILGHSQDILRPLGRVHEMPPEAAVVALERSITLSPLFRTWGLVRRHRLVATDVDWSRGKGPEIHGPVSELLMLVTGRPADVVR